MKRNLLPTLRASPMGLGVIDRLNESRDCKSQGVVAAKQVVMPIHCVLSGLH